MNLRSPLSLTILAIIVGVSCTDPKPHDDSLKTGKAKPSSSYTDTIEIISASAVFYSPDSLQLEKIAAITDKQVFEATMHECFYQMKNSRIVLKENYPDIKIWEVKNASHLLFQKRDGKEELIDLNDKNDPCGIMLFDGVHSPRLADMANIESELGFYFSNRPGR